MKRQAVKIALCSMTVLAASAQAQSSATIYGVLDLGADYAKAGSVKQTRVYSGGVSGSRLGFRGVEDLGGNLAAIFRLEMGVNADEGTSGQGGRAFGREASVGISSKSLGTVTAGRLPLPYYLVQSRIDAFGWIGTGGLLGITRSAPTFSGQLAPQITSARADNAISYASPTVGGFQGRALAALGEGSPVIGRTYSLSGTYSGHGLDFVTSWARQNGGVGNANPGDIGSYTVGGSYDFGVVKTYLGLTDEKNSCSTCTGLLARIPGVAAGRASEFRLTNLGLRYPVGLLTVVGQVIRIQDRSRYAAATGDRDATLAAVGLEYRLSRRTLVHASVGHVNNQNGSNYAIGSGTAQRLANSVGPGDPGSATVTMGINHSF